MFVFYGILGVLLAILNGGLLWRNLFTPALEKYQQVFSIKSKKHRLLLPIIFSAIAGFLAAQQFLQSWSILFSVFLAINLAFVIFAMWVFDDLCMIIPDRFQIYAFMLVIVSQAKNFRDNLYLQNFLLGVLVLLALCLFTWAYERLRKIETIGGADLKILLWMSLLAGPHVFSIVLLASFLALPLVVYKRFIKQDTEKYFAFSPAIFAAFTGVLFFNGVLYV